MSDQERLSNEELEAESATPLPAKEVMSLLDLDADVDLALDLAAPIDLAVAANLNVAAPIDAAASANILSFGSEATAVGDQAVLIDQHISGEATAEAPQSSVIDQSDDVIGAGDTPTDDGTTGGVIDTGDLAASGTLLDVDVNIDADVDAAAPIAGAVAANANIAAPIDAAVAANIGSIDSSATAVAQQTAVINQDLDDVSAEAIADQDSQITQ
ncbi:MAG: peptidoglycan-binding protein [Actinomycetota bacterium]|nr:peptidoglycan-binding protein [Actinomycetota bacterium]MDQ3787862.1 peptidoglycan-binding protein [Actinomycetota bacterium]